MASFKCVESLVEWKVYWTYEPRTIVIQHKKKKQLKTFKRKHLQKKLRKKEKKKEAFFHGIFPNALQIYANLN